MDKLDLNDGRYVTLINKINELVDAFESLNANLANLNKVLDGMDLELDLDLEPEAETNT